MNRRTLILACVSLCLAALPVRAKHDNWVEVRSPHFIVASNAGEKEARRAAVQFEQIRDLFRASVKVASQHQSPVVTILAAKDQKSLSEIMPEYYTKGTTRPAGLFAHTVNQFYMAVDISAPGSNPYHTIYHEYYHSLTMPYFPNLPLWLAEGLADFYGNTEITDKEAGIGRPDPDLIAELRNAKLIPLDVLFNVDQGSPYYNEQNKTSIFYAQSWALAHYLMIGDNQAHRQTLINFLQDLNQGMSTLDAASKAFGDLKQLQKALEHYVYNSRFYYMKAPVPAKVPDSDLRVRPLSEAESDAYIGGFAVIRGQQALAERFLKESIRLDPNVALAYQHLALLEYFRGQRQESIASASKGIALDPKNSLTRYLRAFLSTAGGGQAVRDPQTEDDLRIAIATSPEFAPPYGLLAFVLGANGTNLAEALQTAQKAVELEPGNSGFRLGVAQIYLRMGRYDDAQKAGQFAVLAAREPEEKTHATQFLATLQQIRNLQARQDAQDRDDVDANSAKPAVNRAAETSAAAPAASATSVQPDMKTITGTVMQLSCVGRLEIQVKSTTENVRLHSVPNLRFRILMQRPAPGYEVCKSLKGEQVTVEYKLDDKKGKNGTIYSLKILSADAPDEPAVASAGTQRLRVPISPGNPDEKWETSTTMRGKVGNVTCNGGELVLNLTVQDIDFSLHARDYTQVAIETGSAFRPGEFKPCAQLSGHNVKITYFVVEHKTYDGEIQSIELEE